MISFRKKAYTLLVPLIGLLFIVYQSSLIVPEAHTALLVRINRLAASTQGRYLLFKPGLHFKIPFLMQDILLDRRVQTLTLKTTDTATSAKPTIEYYINWTISNPIRYYQHTKNNWQQVNLLISQQINSLLHTPNFSYYILHGSTTEINSAIAIANKQLKPFGINIVDIGLKQLLFSPEANAKLLKNMSTEQENHAIVLRANGKANAEMIRLNADNAANLILEKAQEQAAIIRAQGDAQAAELYNNAYRKNPKFAAFYLNLQAYQQGFNPAINNFLVLNSKKDLSDSHIYVNSEKQK